MPAKLSRTTRMPYGVTNAAPRQTMADAAILDPTYAAVIALDFLSANDVNALSTAGGGTFTSLTGLGGLAALTSGAVAGTLEYAATPQAAFQITQGQRMFFKWAGTVDNLLGTLQLGFVAANTNLPNGVYITSSTAGLLTLNIVGPGGTTAIPFPAGFTLVAGTQVELGIEIDPYGSVFAYYNPTTGASKSNTDGSIANGPVVAAYAQLNGVSQNLTLPTAVLFASMAVNPTTNVARTMNVDFFVAAQQRGTEQV